MFCILIQCITIRKSIKYLVRVICALSFPIFLILCVFEFDVLWTLNMPIYVIFKPKTSISYKDRHIAIAAYLLYLGGHWL